MRISDGDIRGIDTANVYNNWQAEARGNDGADGSNGGVFKRLLRLVDATEALASRIEPQGCPR